MLDTNTVSDIVTGRSAAARARLLALRDGEAVCVSAITEGELRNGIAKLSHASTRRLGMEAFLDHAHVLAWGRAEAQVYGLLRQKLRAIGTPLQPMDMLIAAHSIAAGAWLVTRDQAFSHVTDLRGIENWAFDVY
jgi:tRNA(fMet)-specific endonuclease VapC